MKKITITITMLCLTLSTMGQENKAIDVTSKGIQIGQQVPDLTLTNLYNYKDANGKVATTAKISDFKGKLLILDFWATWCSPCVAMIPKMDALQEQFGDKVQFLSVTYQAAKEVLPFIQKLEVQEGRHYNLPILTNQKELHKLFPHVYLPHYVWIDEEGVLRAITNNTEVTELNLNSLINSSISLPQKKDYRLKYDKAKPLFMDNNGGNGAGLRYHSVIATHNLGIGSGYSLTTNGDSNLGKKITARNMSIPYLYRLAYSNEVGYIGANRTIIEASNKAALTFDGLSGTADDWIKGNTYCYELIVPANKGQYVFELMKRDLGFYFGDYVAELIPRKIKCLVLVKTTNADKIKTAGLDTLASFDGFGAHLKNASLDLLIANLNIKFMAKSLMPVVNGTGYNANVDLKIDAPWSDLVAVNSELAKYDLAFVEQLREMKMLVIKDKIK